MPLPVFTMPPEPVMLLQKAPAALLTYGSAGVKLSAPIVSVLPPRLIVPVDAGALMSDPIVSLDWSTSPAEPLSATRLVSGSAEPPRTTSGPPLLSAV